MSKSAPFLKVVTSTDEPIEEFTPQDMARIRAGIGQLRRLVDDPVALLERARDLLEGTAPKLFSLVAPVLILGITDALNLPRAADETIEAAVHSWLHHRDRLAMVAAALL